MKKLLAVLALVYASNAFAETHHCLLSANYYEKGVQTMEIDCPKDQATEDAFHAQKFKTLAEALDFVGDRGYEMEVMSPHDISHASRKFIMGYSVIFKRESPTSPPDN